MRQYVYISTAAKDVDQNDIVNILEASSRNNPAREITGFLVYNGRNFLQLVEGPEAALLELMDRIGRDERHSGIVRLEDIEIDARDCEDWTMKRIRLADDITARRADLENILPSTLDHNIRKTILNFATLN